MRAVAAEGCKHLAKQCSDPDTLENLVKHFFGVLNGKFIKIFMFKKYNTTMIFERNKHYYHLLMLHL